MTLNWDGYQELRWVQRMVLESFVGPCPLGLEACHENGDGLDNRPENLRWDTTSNNNLDKDKHGTSLRGERNPRAKMTETKVKRIRAAFITGTRAVVLAKRYKLSLASVYHIINRKTWSHIR